MTRFTILATGTLLLLNSHVAFAQGTEQTVVLTQIAPMTLATGYRTTKVIGSAVYNEAKEEIGNVDDLIITTKETVPYAILSVGGFLGMGKHNVVVPASSLEVVGSQLILHGGSKESLKALPSYTYTY